MTLEQESQEKKSLFVYLMMKETINRVYGPLSCLARGEDGYRFKIVKRKGDFQKVVKNIPLWTQDEMEAIKKVYKMAQEFDKIKRGRR